MSPRNHVLHGAPLFHHALMRIFEQRVVLRRGRLSASPATGLPGLLENVFLEDFFGCFGFLSLVSERQGENGGGPSSRFSSMLQRAAELRAVKNRVFTWVTRFVLQPVVPAKPARGSDFLGSQHVVLRDKNLLRHCAAGQVASLLPHAKNTLVLTIDEWSVGACPACR